MKLIEAIAAHDILGNPVSAEQRDYFEFTTVKQGNKLIPVYHGSKAEFNEFSHELIGTNGDSHGPGFYFAQDLSTANHYGNAKMYYLDITRPINTSKLTFDYSRIYNFLKRLDLDGSHYLEAYDDVYSNGIGKALNEATKQLLEYSSSNWEVVCDVYGGYSGDMKHFCETVKKCLGDGIVYQDNGYTNYIVMTSKQIKLASNVSPKYGTSKIDEKYTLDESLFLEDYSKYNNKQELLKVCGRYVYHATYLKNLKNIFENGLKDFWFGKDMYDCINLVQYNHKQNDNIIVIEIPTKRLNADYCDFTIDSGNGIDDSWAGTGYYNDTINIRDCDSYNNDDGKWYYINYLINTVK